MFDVVEVQIDSLRVALMAEGKSKQTAEKIEEMAVRRRGCENAFFSVVPSGKYKEGDLWSGDGSGD
jgi:hypothetical protein